MSKYPQIVSVVLAITCAASLYAGPAKLTHAVQSGVVWNAKAQFRYEVEITLVPVKKGIHSEKYIGAAYPGEFTCSRFSIALNGRKVSIPKQAYTDLAEVTAVGTPDDADHDTWVLSVFGGSGEAYEVEFLFNNARLLERRLIDTNNLGQARKYLRVDKY